MTMPDNVKKPFDDSEIPEMEKEDARRKVSKDRIKGYGSIADQLDEIYHNGIDSWKAKIKAVKDKYPKEE